MFENTTDRLEPVAGSRETEAPGSSAPVQLARIGALFAIVYIFLIFSRVHDYVPMLRLTAITAGVALFFAGISLQAFRVMSKGVGRIILAFTLCMGLAVVFSIWRGGSAEVFVGTWLRAFFAFVLVGSLLTKLSTCINGLKAMAWGILFTALSGLLLGARVNDRVALWSDARFGDPNDFAQILILGLGAWYLLWRKSSGTWLSTRALAVPAMATMLFVAVRTGSRGGLIGLVGAMIVLLANLSVSKRVMAALAMGTCGLAMLAALPTDLQERYLMVIGIHPVNVAAAADAAEGSQQARLELLKDSLVITARHPLLGVGPGNYKLEQNEMATHAGLSHGSWQETHNMYTQVSSEIGIPGMLIFIAALVACFRITRRIQRRGQVAGLQQLDAVAVSLRMMLVAFCVSGFFLSVAYTTELQILLAFIVAFDRSTAHLPEYRLEPANVEDTETVQAYDAVGVRSPAYL